MNLRTIIIEYTRLYAKITTIPSVQRKNTPILHN